MTTAQSETTDKMKQNLITMTEISTTTTLPKQDMEFEENETRITCSTAATTNAKQEFKSDEIMVGNGDKQLNWNTITRLMSSLLLSFFSISIMVAMVVDAQSEDDSIEQLKKCLNLFSKELAFGIGIGYATVSYALSALFGVLLCSFITMEIEGMIYYIVYLKCW